MASNKKPIYDPTLEQIALECQLIRAEKLEAENDAKLVGRSDGTWICPQVSTRMRPSGYGKTPQ